MLRQRLTYFSKLMRLEKPAGTLLLLWPTLTAIWFASSGHPDVRIILTFTLGVFLCRSAGCCFNDISDQHFDNQVRRTRDRPLASGFLSGQKAILCGITILALSFLTIAWLPVRVWFMAVMAVLLMITYPLTKRFLKVPQAYLGICFGFGIPMAYEAVQHRIPGVCIIMWIANFLWTLSYDTIYAMVDRDDDISIGINSSALFLGSLDLFFIKFWGILSILMWGLAGYCIGTGPLFYMGLIMSSIVMVYFFAKIRDRDRSACLYAFTQNHWIGLVIFVSAVANFTVPSSKTISF
ncbi:4-hydroxybenzoate octaprenyltransferase [Candidatus Ichthyocystis hellenicum]|uniref:4-hydroxybenzoate octaprenyltransferase n=1 Tax=Candidatus Ichthyocystis hellenicum TaxID=1561003 RepID=UPI000B291BD5|nr:4-hydroxybenzoate octaprenyltransferase [Candidatus Ichthyocystis hellenicum]